MLYAWAKADLLPRKMLRKRLYRGVHAYPLTLGALRVAELLENRLVALDCPPVEPFDFGQLIALSRVNWRKFLRNPLRPGLRFILIQDSATPRNDEEMRLAGKWLLEQTDFPQAAHLSETEAKLRQKSIALSNTLASSNTMRLAVSVSAVPNALDLLRVKSVWDAPVYAVVHVLTAQSEVKGGHHVPRDLVETAKEAAQAGQAQAGQAQSASEDVG